MVALAAADLVLDAEASHAEDQRAALLRPEALARQRRSAWRLAAAVAVAALVALGAAASPFASAAGRGAQGCAGGSCRSPSSSLDATLMLKGRSAAKKPRVPPKLASGDDADVKVLDVGGETTTAAAGEETTAAAGGEETTAALAGDGGDEVAKGGASTTAAGTSTTAAGASSTAVGASTTTDA